MTPALHSARRLIHFTSTNNPSVGKPFSASLKLNPAKCICIRDHRSSPHLYVYPKEGVFQPNSPAQQPISQSQQHAHQPPYFSQPPQQPPTRRRFGVNPWISGIVVALGSGILGAVTFIECSLNFLPIVIEPGSPEDHEELELLEEEYESLHLVQELRRQYHFDPITKTRVPEWKEWVAYQALSDPSSADASVERRAATLTTGPLKGSQGLAAQKVFWNERQKIAAVFVNFGPAVCGWPGFVHGGAIATIFEETCHRVASRIAGGLGSMTIATDVTYLNKTTPGQWHVFIAHPFDMDLEKQDAKGSGDEGEEGMALGFQWNLPSAFSSGQEPTSEELDNAKRGTESDMNLSGRLIVVAGEFTCVSELGPSFDALLRPPEDAHVHGYGRSIFFGEPTMGLKAIPEEF